MTAPEKLSRKFLELFMHAIYSPQHRVPGYCEAWIVLPNTHNNVKLQQGFKVSAIVGP
jgi:hypothetical protein